ncbi:PRD domain-containing protein [Cellulomonas sp. C5510]|uniref:PRD domain-containing protein n=1 Tax=Cellulomonas sp. C5510 TaxID=2871170 RepID=UPI001C93759E|nr:PRD domain-containing protein [Cellulomonas sp. C5510]QZN84602.1 PRD domain-containing protein [Cellulomonas sp. C5510]
MDVLRVFNNNLVLARDDRGAEVILTGRGLGFQAKPGDRVAEDRVVRVFRPDDGRDPDHLAGLLAGIPPEHVQLVGEALAEVGLDRLAAKPALVVAMADHIGFALRRAEQGQAVEYPLLAEVTNLYAEEHEQATALLAAVNARVATPLPPTEAVGLALHLVNAGFATGDLSYSYTMTGLIQQFLDVVAGAYGVDLVPGSVSVGRFVTHLRYLFVRIHQRRQLDDRRHSEVGDAIRRTYPEASETADRLARLVELRLQAGLTEDEVSYLALHVARIAQDSRTQDDARPDDAHGATAGGPGEAVVGA